MNITVRVKFNYNLIIEDINYEDWKDSDDLQRYEFVQEKIKESIENDLTDLINESKIIYTYDDEQPEK